MRTKKMIEDKILEIAELEKNITMGTNEFNAYSNGYLAALNWMIEKNDNFLLFLFDEGNSEKPINDLVVESNLNIDVHDIMMLCYEINNFVKEVDAVTEGKLLHQQKKKKEEDGQ